ncbi:hypothetical protein [Streptobacillus moniliformis]|uniref:Uncharacterized protein n=1 Tax=Streptobacillus moniliformis (strain ATCC 14647 / DSM 12112 / NCTC 10651 / 9901) TaxID=519441 RepID=D1AYH2_STRM9|nr:hypothetical protein [Streptobacillus moniliformis]ACZ01348.1 hypothetical protein Smon_0881 [Streptobacillus moniliformis DSM 12112]AVL43634.1 hypothetical protein CEP89_07440 [Streptobacillus moniliformis]SQA13493.1 Uncharacterised protein [Streptobacillus moniliformis]
MDELDVYRIASEAANSVSIDTSKLFTMEDFHDYAGFLKEKFFEVYDRLEVLEKEVKDKKTENEELKKEINELKTEIELLKQEKNYDDYYSLDL